MSDNKLQKLQPMSPVTAAKLLERLDDDWSRNITKTEARAALTAFLRAHDSEADAWQRSQYLVDKTEAERDRLRALLERAAEVIDLAVDRVEGEMVVGQLPPGNSIRPRYASVLADIRKELGK